ncbi:MAG: hypothetical protein KHX55_04850 [Proteobacteria bacterium]|nr:hypothetical protein [Pseudomonadota bacterium]
MTEKNSEYWSEEVTRNEDYHTPPGTFTKKAGEIVKILLREAGYNALKALHRIIFYINRAGSKLPNVDQVEKAKTDLEQIEKEQKNNQ